MSSKREREETAEEEIGLRSASKNAKSETPEDMTPEDEKVEISPATTVVPPKSNFFKEQCLIAFAKAILSGKCGCPSQECLGWSCHCDMDPCVCAPSGCLAIHALKNDGCDVVLRNKDGGVIGYTCVVADKST